MGWFFKKKSSPQDLHNLQRQKDKADKKMQEWLESGNYINCPECNGTGVIERIFAGYKGAEICSTCSGQKRIWVDSNERE